jgi:hypothetical protein
MEDKIKGEENLYRAIKRSKRDWLDANGKPTSVMFKDENGNSVDRDAGREMNDIIRFMKQGVFKKRLKGVVRVNAGKCMEPPIQAIVKAAPSNENPYHANIYIDKNKQIGQLQAFMLADSSEVVYEDKSMDWVYL